MPPQPCFSIQSCSFLFFPPLNDIQPTSVNIEALKAFPFIDDVTALKAELPSYLSASGNVSACIDFASGGRTTKCCLGSRV